VKVILAPDSVPTACLLLALFGHRALSVVSPKCAQERTSTKYLDDGARQHAFQGLRAKRDSKLMYLTAWIASFVRLPCR
jgi:hypothetical protein